MFITKLIQVTVVACVYSLPMVSCQDVAKDLVGGVEKILGDTTTVPVKRYSMLYNECTRKHLTIIGKNITALGKETSPYANMSLETVVKKNTIGLRIRGVKSKRFLCFNKRGRLVSRTTGKHKNCLFKEIMASSFFSQFQSMFNPDWLVGFNSRGKPLKGTAHRRKSSCTYFIKRGDKSYMTPQLDGQGPIDVPLDPSILNLQLFAKNGEKRHQKRNGGRQSKRNRQPSR